MTQSVLSTSAHDSSLLSKFTSGPIHVTLLLDTTELTIYIHKLKKNRLQLKNQNYFNKQTSVCVSYI